MICSFIGFISYIEVTAVARRFFSHHQARDRRAALDPSPILLHRTRMELIAQLQKRGRRLVAACAAASIISTATIPAEAQNPRDNVVIPFYGDPRVRTERPDGPIPRNLRVVTDDEFPPLHFADPDGLPAGFSVDLMRAVCERLAVNCTIQTRRFDTLLQALADGQADVAAAAMPVSSQIKARFHVSRIYHRLPARFIGANGFTAGRFETGLEGVQIAVVQDTAHAAFLAEHFPKARTSLVRDLESALSSLQRGEVELAFGDGQAGAIWLGARSAGFRFQGGAYISPRHFGEGIGFVMRPDEPNLKRSVDYALQALWDDGTYARLFLRYFPVSPF